MGHEMNERMSLAAFREMAPEVAEGMSRISRAAAANGVEKGVLELVKVRASQINGCAFCLQMHVTEARKAGVSEEKLQLAAVWREAPVYTAREQAALGVCEALTRVAEAGLPEEVYGEAMRVFTEKELAYLMGAVVGINAWNRVAVGYRFRPEVAGGSV